MSQRNVEIIRRGYRRFVETGEFQAEITHPDFVWDMSTFGGWPEAQTYPGIAGAQRFMADWTESWDDWELELIELIDAGDEEVLAILRQRGRSKGSGVEVDMDFAQLWTLRDGMQLRMRMYSDIAEARRAAGLAPGP